MAKKLSLYQIAWSSPTSDNPDWVGFYDLDATNAITAITQFRSYATEVHGYTAKDTIIHEVYKV